MGIYKWKISWRGYVWKRHFWKNALKFDFFYFCPDKSWQTPAILSSSRVYTPIREFWTKNPISGNWASVISGQKIRIPKSVYNNSRWLFCPKMTLAQFPEIGFFVQNSLIGVKWVARACTGTHPELNEKRTWDDLWKIGAYIIYNRFWYGYKRSLAHHNDLPVLPESAF